MFLGDRNKREWEINDAERQQTSQVAGEFSSNK